MPFSVIRNKRSQTAGQTPTGLVQGEIAHNIPDKQVFAGTSTAADPLIGVRYHSDTADYVVGDLVVFGADIYRCIVAHTAQVFSLTNFSAIVANIGDQTQFNYVWDATGTPAAGEIGVDILPPNAINTPITVRLSDTTANGVDVSGFWTTIQVGDYITFEEDTGDFESAFYLVTDEIVPQGGYYDVPTTYQGGTGTPELGSTGIVSYIQAPGNKLPVGGNPGDHIVKQSTVNYDTAWEPVAVKHHFIGGW